MSVARDAGCGAKPLPGRESWWVPCTDETTAVYVAVCVHGHVRQGRLCAVHLGAGQRGAVVCIPCLQDGGHECRLVGFAGVDEAGNDAGER
ncbi:hypothetical protein AB0G05_19765 [Nonomuraea wenchangensis]